MSAPIINRIQCCICNLTLSYHQFGTECKWHTGARFKEPVYMLRNSCSDCFPIVVGGNCAVCNQFVCMSEECSVYDFQTGKRYCKNHAHMMNQDVQKSDSGRTQADSSRAKVQHEPKTTSSIIQQEQQEQEPITTCNVLRELYESKRRDEMRMKEQQKLMAEQNKAKENDNQFQYMPQQNSNYYDGSSNCTCSGNSPYLSESSTINQASFSVSTSDHSSYAPEFSPLGINNEGGIESQCGTCMYSQQFGSEINQPTIYSQLENSIQYDPMCQYQDAPSYQL